MNLSPVTEESSCTWAKWERAGKHKPHPGANPRPSVLSERALNAEEIADTHSVARSNVSTSLKELQGWSLRDRTD